MYEQDFDYDFTFGEAIEISVIGSSTGTGKEGNSYTANTKQPIIFVAGCDHAVSVHLMLLSTTVLWLR